MSSSRMSFVALFVVVLCSGAWANDSSADPRITTQGFSIDTALRAEAGRFNPVRVRIEAPSRIAKLEISDGDVVIDLASTPDRALFALFGLDQRPMNAFDITLDFAPYINDRLTKAATYRIGITVVDRDGMVAQDAITATVTGGDNAAINDNNTARPLEETVLKLERQGTGNVEPMASSPLAWVTQEAIHVTIRLRPMNPGATLHQLPSSSWDSVMTESGLELRLSGVPPVPYIDIQAARNGAAGTVVALSQRDGNALIRLTGSETSVSALGTTVVLTAILRD